MRKFNFKFLSTLLILLFVGLSISPNTINAASSSSYYSFSLSNNSRYTSSVTHTLTRSGTLHMSGEIDVWVKDGYPLNGDMTVQIDIMSTSGRRIGTVTKYIDMYDLGSGHTYVDIDEDISYVSGVSFYLVIRKDNPAYKISGNGYFTIR